MTTTSKRKAWAHAFRPHTLPLALCGIMMGNVLAIAQDDKSNPLVFGFSVLTAMLLQILSNVANDYGDFKNGADNEKRVGPARMTQQKVISEVEMKRGIYILVFLSLISGILLLVFSAPIIGTLPAVILLGIGLISIAAAIAYTATSKPYGYSGWGDVSVFIFFGIVGVFGSYYLQSGRINAFVMLPAAGFGLLSAAVLNVNNVRDIESDSHAGKRTIAVRLGISIAKMYHWSLLLSAILLFSAYGITSYSNVNSFYFLIPAVLFLINAVNVSKTKHATEVVPLLKQLVIFIMIFTISFIISLLI